MPSYHRDQSIPARFEEVVRRGGERVALVLPGRGAQPEQTLTYRELDLRANHVAALIRESGAARGSFVATYMDRSLETIVAFLGILKAGCAYVPLDPAYPKERVTFMVEDTQAPVLLTQQHLAPTLPQGVVARGTRVICLDAGFGAGAIAAPLVHTPPLTGGDLAYVIYTSGSTGKPKGVCVPHRGVVRLVIDNHFTPMDETRVFLQLAPVSFDAATLEIWAPLLHGGRCVLYPGSGVPDLDFLRETVVKTGVTTMWLTSSLFNLVIDRAPATLRSVAEVLAGGEALSVHHIKRALEVLPSTQLVNGYGPTESTTFTCCFRIPRALDPKLASIPIGTAIAHTDVFILNERRERTADGEIGDLYVGGDGLATGYLNRPELTAERFVESPFAKGERLYFTGDRVRRLPDGNIEFCGRTDDQVKIGGHRIELGEIETALGELAAVEQAVVLAREDSPGDKRLVAYVTAKKGETLTAGRLRSLLEARLPSYMVPGAFVLMDALPLSPMGKVDRKALPKPGRKRPELERGYVAPRKPLEKLLCKLWEDTLEIDSVGVHDRYFELGGTSLQAVRFVARLSDELKETIPIVSFFEAPTIAEIAAVLLRDHPAAVARFADGAATTGGEDDTAAKDAALRGDSRGDAAAGSSEMAIVGLAGRFPGAKNARAFWTNLERGVEATKPVTAEDLERGGLDVSLLANPDFVPLSFHLDEAESFDAAFFGMTPREAELMDPQQRIFLECAYAALEDAGYDPSRYRGKIGIFGGVGRNPYMLENLAVRPEFQGRLIEHHLQIGNERDFPSMHVAYKLDLKGPAVNVQTACSTSGVALHLACQSLKSGDSDMVLVGGAKILGPSHAGYVYVDGGALAPDGHVRAFDAKAGGMVRGSGCGMLVLKRLRDALRDGDNIRAVVKGTAINNDGGAKIGFTAPSVQGQSEVITRALELAGLSADDIDYVETHGTGTVIGDPMEVAGLTRAYRKTTTRTGYCRIGSVKTNIGHLDAGAMAAGLIKTVLSLEHEALPPSLNFEKPNPQIDFAKSPFVVNGKLSPWPRGQRPRRAGISAFGLGGTNAHAIVEEAPLLPPTGAGRSHELLVLSAKTETALARAREELAEHLAANPKLALADVAHTLLAGRRRFTCRAAVVASSPQDAVVKLLGVAADGKPGLEVRNGADKTPLAGVVFMFPGGGAQYARMAEGLRHEPAFAEAFARCADHLRPLLGAELADLVYGGDVAKGALEKPSQALPALFAVEYSVAMLLRSWGIEPTAMIGHSMGEYTAACLAGVMSLKDALGVVLCRGRLFEKLPKGSMLGIPLSADEARPFMTPDLSFAAINRRDQCVASGEVASIDALAAKLERADIEPTRIHIDVAAHSSLVEPILAEFAAYLRTLELHAPTMPVVSNVTGTWLRPDEARDPEYWVRHLRQTVRFADGVDCALEGGGRALVEVGPGRTLVTLAKSHPAAVKDALICTVRHPSETVSDVEFLERAAARLWLLGLPLADEGRFAGQSRRRVPLPSYCFERKRYFLDPAPSTVTAPLSVAASEPSPSPVASSVAPPLPVPVPELPPLPSVLTAPVQTLVFHQEPAMPTQSRKDRIVTELQRILQELSGLDASRIDPAATFLELGFDSLFLTQANGAFRKRFGVKTTVRQLLEKAPGVGALADFLDGQLAPDAFPEETAVAPALPAPLPVPASELRQTATEASPVAPAPAPVVVATPVNGTTGPVQFAPTPIAAPVNASAVERVIAQQLSVMQAQLAALGASPSLPASLPVNVNVPVPVHAPTSTSTSTSTATPTPTATTTTTPTTVSPRAATKPGAAEIVPEKKVNKESPWQPVDKGRHDDSGALTPEQQAHIDTLIRAVCERAPTSKSMTQKYRAQFADPRTVQGFKLQWKEMVFPIIAAKTEGSKLWDLDGNEYIDLVNGYGVTFLGHNPPFLREAIKEQLDRGVEIGPQNRLAGPLAELFCELTGNERAAFCNTGSEAVIAAIRLARTVTGKDGIATFAGHYHGIFDEVLVKGVTFGGKKKTVPIAPGIPQRHVEHTLVLKYGDMESLEEIKKHADELALVLVEPIRSRNPDNQPVEFVRALRKLTEEHNIALLFDENGDGLPVAPGRHAGALGHPR
ncbi:MAG: amino acid adenylation domain-containing protein [Myxococcales bacterium]|nr:amino acid adenylation domain-containing protein [Myxococcales bacterium]